MSFVARHLIALAILIVVLAAVAVVSVTSLSVRKAFRDLSARDGEMLDRFHPFSVALLRAGPAPYRLVSFGPAS